MMSDNCDGASDDDFCIGGYGTFTPEATGLTLCRRHYNQWRHEHGKHVMRTVRPRYADGEAVPGRHPVPLSDAPWRG